MTWTVSPQFDKDSNDVGLAVAIWTEPTGSPPLVFMYPDRLRANAAGANEFVAKAIAARNAWQAKNAQNAAAVPILLAKLNAADPQAGV